MKVRRSIIIPPGAQQSAPVAVFAGSVVNQGVFLCRAGTRNPYSTLRHAGAPEHYRRLVWASYFLGAGEGEFCLVPFVESRDLVCFSLN